MRWMNTIGTLVATLVLLGALSPAVAQPTHVNYQGELKRNDTPFDGTAEFKFAIVDTQTGTTLWSNDGTSTTGDEPAASVSVDVTAGVFTVLLGASPMIALTANDIEGLSSGVLRVWVDTGDGFEQLSDQPISSSAFALHSESSATGGAADDDWVIDDPNIYRLSGNVGIGVDAPEQRLHVNGDIEASGMTSSARVSGSGSIELFAGLGLGGDPAHIDFKNDSADDFDVRLRLSGDDQLQVDGGSFVVPVLEITGGADLAEPFAFSERNELEPGSVVVIDSANPGQLKLSERAYDPRVAGVISGAGGVNAGLTLSQRGVTDGGQNVALTGRVYVKATTSNGTIHPGDLLTTSDVPGHAMRATDRARSGGTILGKAMTPLEATDGLVLVLVSLQ